MKAGALRHLLTIQQPAQGTADDYGKPAITWTDVDTVWAEVVPTGGAEVFRGMQLRSDTTHLVRMRYYTSLTADMRLKFGTRYLHPEMPFLNRDERNREISVQCREVVE